MVREGNRTQLLNIPALAGLKPGLIVKFDSYCVSLTIFSNST